MRTAVMVFAGLTLALALMAVPGCTTWPGEPVGTKASPPPYAKGECLVLGNDDVWRKCA